jgi:TRAP-type uncharacterized transport system substrate-binding protein
MTIRRAELALVVIAAASAASGGKAQIVESPHHQVSNTSTLRIAPLAGPGPVQNVADLLSVRGIDAAIVPSDVLPYLRGGRLRGADSSIAYIKKLDQEEVHILARQDITSIADLAGKKVNFELRDSRAFITGSVLFRALKINVQPVSLDQPRALQQLRQGEIAAIVHVAKSPARLFFDLNRDDRVHFLPVPFTEEVSRTYLPARLAPADYPLLIGGGETGRGTPVATVAVPIVLAVNSRALETGENGHTSTLIDAASSRAIALQGRLSGPISRQDQTMEVPGWRRFVPTEDRLKGVTSVERASAKMQSTPKRGLEGMQHKKEEARLSPHSQQQRFSTAPQQSDEQRLNGQADSTTSTADTTAERVHAAKQREALLREFLRWREQLSISHKQPPQADEDVFDRFMRSLEKR